jgi:Flp pilus assembly protein TadB
MIDFEKIPKLERRMQSDVSGIISALLCALVAWSLAPLLIAGIYFFLMLWNLNEWYWEMKRQKVRSHFKKLRQNL